MQSTDTCVNFRHLVVLGEGELLNRSYGLLLFPPSPPDDVSAHPQRKKDEQQPPPRDLTCFRTLALQPDLTQTYHDLKLYRYSALLLACEYNRPSIVRALLSSLLPLQREEAKQEESQKNSQPPSPSPSLSSLPPTSFSAPQPASPHLLLSTTPSSISAFSLLHSGLTPLFVASELGNLAVLSLLLLHGFPPDELCTSDGCTALHAAAFWGRESCVRALLEGGADRRRVGGGRDVRGWAALGGRGGVCELLLMMGEAEGVGGKT